VAGRGGGGEPWEPMAPVPMYTEPVILDIACKLESSGPDFTPKA